MYKEQIDDIKRASEMQVIIKQSTVQILWNLHNKLRRLVESKYRKKFRMCNQANETKKLVFTPYATAAKFNFF